MNTKQALFEEINYHLLNDAQPSIYLKGLSNNKIFRTDFPFTLLSDLKGVKQSPVHHPEGNVWNHTMLVVDSAAQQKKQSKNINVFMWSALLHDIGKKDATKVRNGRITAYDHDKIGAKYALDFLREFSEDENFIKKVASMVRWHMQLLYIVKNMPYAKVEEMKKEVPIHEIALLGLCDRLGRGLTDEKAEQENIQIFIEKCGINLAHF